MFSFKRCVLGIGLVLCGCAVALAAPPLTIVQDILFNADGTRFNGVATVSWQSFEASDMSNVLAHSITTQIINGLLRVQLVPTTNALSPASYNVVYNTDGNTQFQETWAVPPSSVPVRVRDIRIGGPGTTVGGGTGPGQIVNTVNISDVVGLTAALTLRAAIGTGYTPSRAAVIDAAGALDGAIGNVSDCVHVDGSSGPCGGTGTSGSAFAFVDGEIPTGVINGANAAFLLGNAPLPGFSLALFRNGLRLTQGSDYALSNSAVTFVQSAIPQANDVLLASYRIGANSTGLTFVDSETPTGVVDGSNTVFAVSQVPNPAASLSLYRNGMRLRANLDYILTGSSLLFLSGLAPQPGDVLVCSYRLGTLVVN
jgi:hypothetical protein